MAAHPERRVTFFRSSESPALRAVHSDIQPPTYTPTYLDGVSKRLKKELGQYLLALALGTAAVVGISYAASYGDESKHNMRVVPTATIPPVWPTPSIEPYPIDGDTSRMDQTPMLPVPVIRRGVQSLKPTDQLPVLTTDQVNKGDLVNPYDGSIFETK